MEPPLPLRQDLSGPKDKDEPSMATPKLDWRGWRAVKVLAMRAAIIAVKARLREQGRKPQWYSHKEVVVMAEDYIREHRAELVPRAIVIAQEFEAEEERRREWQRQRRRERNSKDLRSARRSEPQGLSLCKSHAQNGDAK